MPISELSNANPITIVIFGAFGDLTQRKLIPALFNLYCKGCLPTKTQIDGLAVYGDVEGKMPAEALQNSSIKLKLEDFRNAKDEFFASDPWLTDKFNIWVGIQ